MTERTSDCRGCELDAGVWYCAVHGSLYFCVPKMANRFMPKYKGQPMLMMQGWLDSVEWPLTTLPINSAVFLPFPVVLAQEDDFESVGQMFRWMDTNGIKRVS